MLSDRDLKCVLFIQFVLSIRVNVSMRLDSREFHAILTPDLKKLAAIFEKYGFKDEIRIVGGAVRDLLSGRKPADLDFATTATPQEMKDMFKAEGVRMFNSNGEKHGTISVRIDNRENFEITTLRDDVITDGRHAIVQFTRDWFVDATRRDLTINAMYLDLEGNLYDYYNGYEDLKNNRVLFVGDADKRIKEDYLRILRYFRFFGRIARDPNGHDEKTLQAIRDNVSGLNRISGERIWSELQRILTGNFANDIVKVMFKLGLTPFIGLNNLESLDITCFDVVCRNHKKYVFKPVTFVVSLLKTKDEVSTLHNRLKLSAFERDLGYFIVEHKNDILPHSDDECFRYFRRMLIFTKLNHDALRAFILEFLKLVDRESVMVVFSGWTAPVFPVDGKVLMKRGIKGVQLGLALKELKDRWEENDFVLREDLIIDVINRFKSAKRE